MLKIPRADALPDPFDASRSSAERLRCEGWAVAHAGNYEVHATNSERPRGYWASFAEKRTG
ncbi:MAG: hypothetical protein FJ090_18085 [Deltaproteobacteria bacterium]|nr:hypothetical protein [Deltaproteobacteria bacterium]